jgi:hypothetical protein
MTCRDLVSAFPTTSTASWPRAIGRRGAPRGLRQCHLVLDTTQCTILLYRATHSPTLDARAAKHPPAPEKACRVATASPFVAASLPRLDGDSTGLRPGQAWLARRVGPEGVDRQ